MHLVVLALILQGVATPPTIPVVGCNRFQIIITQPAVVSVRGAGGLGCGPLSISVDSGARYDLKSRTLSLSVALKNNWNRALVAPARLISWPDSFFLATYGGVLPKGREYYIIPSNADSALGTPSMRNGKSYFWRYDSFIGTSPHAGTLLPGERTRSRTIKIKLEEGSSSDFTIVLHAEAWNPNSFPDDPPRMSAGDLIAGANVVIDVEGLPPGRVLSDVVEARFDRRSTPVQRQAILDAISGTVVGASAPSETEDRVYFVRLDPNGMRAPIVALLEQNGGRALPNDIAAIALDSLLLPEFRRPALYLAPVGGCVSLRVRVSGSSASADNLPGPSCGPVVPEVAGPIAYDARTHQLRIPIRLANHWRLGVAGPLRILAWNEKISDIAPAPICGRPGRVSHGAYCPAWNGPEGGRVTLIGFDSTIGAGASEFASAVTWRFPNAPAAYDGRNALPGGSISATRVISLGLADTAVREFTIVLRSFTENEHPVPARAPRNGDPANAFTNEHRIPAREGEWSSPVLNDLIDVTFAGDPSQAERQAALDSIDGQVVGGFQRFPNGDGTYVVRISGDQTGEKLAVALKRLRTMEGRPLAMPIESPGGAHRYDAEPPAPEDFEHLKFAELGQYGLPTWFRDDTAQYAGKYIGRVAKFSKYVVEVFFRIGTSRQAMSEALDSIGGKLIGAHPPGGSYHVIIRGAGSQRRIDLAIKKVESLPQVEFADPVVTYCNCRLLDALNATGDPGTTTPRDSTTAPARTPPS